MNRRVTIERLMPLLICHLITFYAMAQTQTSITVKIHNNAGNSVSLYKVENGEANRMSFRWPAGDDTCVFSFPMEQEGVYYLAKTSGKGSDYNYVLYLKPGDNKWIDAYSSMTTIDFDSCKIVEPNAETQLLQEWTNTLNKYCKLGVNRVNREQFIAAYKNFEKEADQMTKKAVLDNKYFNSLFISKVEAETQYPKAAAFFNFASRMNADCDSSEKHQSFYSSLVNQKFCSTGLLFSENGMQLLKYCLSYNILRQYRDKNKMLTTPFAEKVKLICNDTVRGAFITQYMMGVTNYEQFQKDIEPFKASLVLPAMKKTYQQKLDELTLYARGLPGYNFSLPDADGNTVSLNDFKGKYVVVDMWAMWCAPCLQEKPYFEKLQEKYSDRKDIVFIGVSVDGQDRMKVWKQFLEKHEWNGIELISNPQESLMNYYKIKGIPRIMVFDQSGKIVTVDAPRPSTPEFKILIEKLLQKNIQHVEP